MAAPVPLSLSLSTRYLFLAGSDIVLSRVKNTASKWTLVFLSINCGSQMIG